jgi:hypothetical protein
VTAIAVSSDRQVVQARRSDSLPAPVAGSVVKGPEPFGVVALRGVEFPVPVLVPGGARPRLGLGKTQEAHDDPVVLHQREVFQQAAQGECGRRQALVQLFTVQAVRLELQGRPLVVQELVDGGPLVGMGIGIVACDQVSLSSRSGTLPNTQYAPAVSQSRM